MQIVAKVIFIDKNTKFTTPTLHETKNSVTAYKNCLCFNSLNDVLTDTRKIYCDFKVFTALK